MESHKWFLHVDLDAFFASVEQLDNPSYRGKPVIVGGKPEDRRSVVSTASYEARKYGVHSAMPTYQAYKLCPHGIYVHGRMERYAELSYKIMNIFRDFSPDVQQMSIDEAFIDLTGTEQLFGPPSETAMTIKKRVREETGLTVSIGLATTQYLAKIASGYSKPDGFYFVEPGKEEEFMLSLPLDKLWGVGKKSQELLKSKGLKSIRAIHDTDIDLLEFMVGKNMAAFLYDAVRGGKNKDFGREAKSHSISAETTFPIDITDVYTAETSILELAQGVYFRLLRENCYSKTAFVKIRYDDFTTVSIRETENRNILTLDSFFEILKRIFEKKYQSGRGIRLLGVGLDNIENEEKSYQPDLFDNGTEKRQAVEKAILKLEKKHPEIKIQKARLLKSISVFFTALALSAALPQKISAETKNVKSKGAGTVISDSFPPPLIVEAPVSLFDWKISDRNTVDFLVSGYWQAEATAGITGTFGNNITPAISAALPVLRQSADLSAWFLLNNQFYFETNISDEFQKSRIALGYKGNGILKSAELSNRNITMEKGYSAENFGYSLSGGKNQAPGLMMHFGDISSRNFWSGDFLIRYDMTESKSAVYYGKNLATDSKILISNFLYGHAFVFPETDADKLLDIKDIYVESAGGNFVDASGKKYKKLSLSDYRIFHKDSMLVLNQSASAGKNGDKIPGVLITFNTKSAADEIILHTGNFNEPESFAGVIQTYFDSSGRHFDLSEFSYNLKSNIENSPALVIQNPIGFSPYLHGGFYDCGTSFDGDISIINILSEKTLTDFSASINGNINSSEELLSENHNIAEIFNHNHSDFSYQSPSVRFPFGETEPETYLNIAGSETTGILLRNYSPVSNYDIGTEAIAGTVLVYVNDIIDAGASYNQGTGIIELTSSVSPADKVYITWQEDSFNAQGGAISTGAGIKFNFTDSLKGNVILSARWPLSVNARFATTENNQNGFAALSTGLNYNGNGFYISDESSAAITNQNGTGLLLVSENTAPLSKTSYLLASDGYTVQTEPYITAAGRKFYANQNRTVKNHAGIKDANISGYAIPLQWDFQNEENCQWAAVDIKLSDVLELKNSTQLEIAIKPDFLPAKAAETQEYDVYLQLGINAGNTTYSEDSSLLPSWKITDISQKDVITPLNLSKNQWQTVTVKLDDVDRSKLSSNCDARILITKKNDFSAVSSGTIFIGPYEPTISAGILMHSQKIEADSKTFLSMFSPGNHKLHKTENYASRISWKTETDILSEENTEITSVKYFDSADFSSYGTINLDFSITGEMIQKTDNPPSPALTLILDSGSSSPYTEGMESVRLVINSLDHLIAGTQDWHTLTIDLRSNQVLIDQIPLDNTNYILFKSESIVPDRMKLIINTVWGKNLITKGNFCYDNLYYGETSPYLNLQNHFQAEYKKEGEILKLGNFSALNDAALSFNSTQQVSSRISDIYGEQNQKITANTAARITVAQINISAEAGISASSQESAPDFTGAAYTLQTQKPLFSFLTFGENFRLNGLSSSAYKNDFILFDFTEYKVPLLFGIKTQAIDSVYKKNQEAAIDFNAGYENKYAGFNWSNNLTFKQMLIKKPSEVLFEDWKSPASSFQRINAMEFSTGESSADSRNIIFNSKLDLPLPIIKISPFAEYKAERLHSKNITESASNNTSIAFGLPVTMDSSSVILAFRREGNSISSKYDSTDYFSDITSYFSDLQKLSWIYTTVPVYDFYNTELANSIKLSQSAGNYKSAAYNSYIDLSWKRKFSASLADLFVPLNTNLIFGRYISISDTVSDSYQAKLNLGFSSLNNFGQYGKIKIFKWYEQDEVISNLTATIKIPSDKPENTSLLITAYIQANVFITETKQINAAIEYSGDTGNGWNIKLSGIYSRPGKSSILTVIPLYFINERFNFDYKITRKDSVNLEIENSTEDFKQKYDYLHTIDIKFMKYYTFSTGLGLTFSTQTAKACSLGTSITIGGKVEF